MELWGWVNHFNPGIGGRTLGFGFRDVVFVVGVVASNTYSSTVLVRRLPIPWERLALWSVGTACLYIGTQSMTDIARAAHASVIRDLVYPQTIIIQREMTNRSIRSTKVIIRLISAPTIVQGLSQYRIIAPLQQ
jgi:hypothetical protein